MNRMNWGVLNPGLKVMMMMMMMMMLMMMMLMMMMMISICYHISSYIIIYHLAINVIS